MTTQNATAEAGKAAAPGTAGAPGAGTGDMPKDDMTLEAVTESILGKLEGKKVGTEEKAKKGKATEGTEDAEAEEETDATEGTEGEAEETEAGVEEDAGEDTEATEAEEETDATEGTEDTEEEAEAEPEDLKGLPEKTKAKIQARIDKLVAERESAKGDLTARDAEIKDLKAQLDTAQPIRLTPTPDDPMSGCESMDDITAMMQSAKAVKRWAQDNPEGAIVKGKDGQDVELDAAAVREHLHRAEDVLDAAPRRAQFLQNRAAFDAEAKEVYPTLFTTGTEEAQLMQGFTRAFPDVMKLPNWRLLVGDAIAGQKARLAAAAAKASGKPAAPAGKPAAKPAAKPAPKIPKVPGGNPTVSAKDLERKRAKERFDATGDIHAAEDVIASRI